jgi:hypothetical protein
MPKVYETITHHQTHNALTSNIQNQAYTANLKLIPVPKKRFSIWFKRIDQFCIEVLARNVDEAYASAISSFQAYEGRAQLLISILDYFTAEELTQTQGD